MISAHFVRHFPLCVLLVTSLTYNYVTQPTFEIQVTFFLRCNRASKFICMGKAALIVLLLLVNNLVAFQGLSQGAVQHSPSFALTRPDEPPLTPSQYTVPWQRLLLQLSYS